MQTARTVLALLALAVAVTGCAKREDASTASTSASPAAIAAAPHADKHDDGLGKMLRFDAAKSKQLTLDEQAYLTKVNHTMFKIKAITNLKIQLDTTELQVIVSDPEWSQASAAEQKKVFAAIASDWQKRCIAYQRAVAPKAPLIRHCNTAIMGQSGTTYKNG